MSVAVSDVRSYVSDAPTPFPKPGESPEFLGTGDGTTTVFTTSRIPYSGLALPNGQGLTVWQSSGNNVWTQVTSGWTLQNNDQIVFTAAPVPGVKIGARYYETTWTDAELQSILTISMNSSAASGQGDDVVLYKCQYDAIGQLLMNRAKLTIYRRGDVSDDIQGFIQALSQQHKLLSDVLFGKKRPGVNVPSVVVAAQQYSNDQPRR